MSTRDELALAIALTAAPDGGAYTVADRLLELGWTSPAEVVVKERNARIIGTTNAGRAVASTLPDVLQHSSTQAEQRALKDASEAVLAECSTQTEEYGACDECVAQHDWLIARAKAVSHV